MRGTAGGVWTRTDIEQVIVKHDGYAGRAEAPAGFVPPKNVVVSALPPRPAGLNRVERRRAGIGQDRARRLEVVIQN